MSKSTKARKKRRAVLFAIIGGPLIVGVILIAAPGIFQRLGPQVNVTVRVTADTSCNFVLPLEGELADDPTQLPIFHPVSEQWRRVARFRSSTAYTTI